jgi:hypothetical protein
MWPGRWEIGGQASCDFELLPGEVLAGGAASLVELDSPTNCLVFAFGGPAQFAEIRLTDAFMALHSGVMDDSVRAGLLDSATNDLRSAVPECDRSGITYIVLPQIISIPGSYEQGVRYTVPLAGEYEINIVGGTYSSYPIGHPNSLWRTRINIYVNRPIEWAQRQRTHEIDDPSLLYLEPSNPDSFIGAEEILSREAADLAGTTSPPASLNLQRGDFLIFVPIDDQGWYDNPQPNPGEVTLRIVFSSR